MSTPASGQLRGMIGPDGSIHYELSFSGLTAPVTQAHIHFGQHGVSGGVMIWLCGTEALSGPAGTPRCPQEGSVTGMGSVVGPAGQGIAAGDVAAALAAIRAGTAYANVHSTRFGGGEIRGQIRASSR